MNIRRILIIITTTIIILTIGFTAWKSYDIGYQRGIDYGEKNAESIRNKKKEDVTEQVEKKKVVNVIRTRNKINQQVIECSGTVSSLQEIRVSSEVQGKLFGNRSLRKGRSFKKGEIIVSIKNKEFILQLESQRTKFLELVSFNLPDIKLEFPDEFEKWNNYKNNISTSSNLSPFPKTKTDKEKNFIISKSILSQYTSIKSQEEKLKKYKIRAPFNGVISESYTDIGAVVNPGTPIIDIIRDELMEIELTVNKNEINKINIGDSLELTDKDDNKRFNAKIIRKSKFLDKKTQNISVFAKISNTENIYSGMFLNAMIYITEDINTVNIPIRSIFGNNNIWIVINDRLQKEKITKHSSSINNTINIIGFKDKTLIVSEPIINAKEGMIVDPIIN